MRDMMQVKVKTSSKESILQKVGEGLWVAKLKSPPVDGKANKELIELVSREMGVAKKNIHIKMGKSARIKWLEIEC